MSTDEKYSEYFELRNIDKNYYENFTLPKYLFNRLPENKNAAILDIGCGIGQYLVKLKHMGYNNIKGVDVSDSAVNICRSNGLNVEKINSIQEYCSGSNDKFDFIHMAHVLEHLPKDDVIASLTAIKSVLIDDGCFCVVVPNAQSNTGSYWAYEDFTHYTLYTSGSLSYVLKAAGFRQIEFLDPKGVEGSSPLVKIIKLLFLPVYALNKKFWNIITSGSYHKPSPVIFTFDLKVLAKK